MRDNEIKKKGEALANDAQLRQIWSEASKVKHAEQLAKTGTERQRIKFKAAKKALKAAKRKPRLTNWR